MGCTSITYISLSLVFQTRRKSHSLACQCWICERRAQFWSCTVQYPPFVLVLVRILAMLFKPRKLCIIINCEQYTNISKRGGFYKCVFPRQQQSTQLISYLIQHFRISKAPVYEYILIVRNLFREILNPLKDSLNPGSPGEVEVYTTP